MSAKRAYLEADSNAGALGASGAEIEPYRTYLAAHEALVSLRSMCSESDILGAGQRALLTVTISFPLASSVRQVAVRLAALVCAHPATDSVTVVAGLALALPAAEPSVRCEIYQALGALHEVNGMLTEVTIPKDAKGALDAAILGDLNHSQHHLRSAALAILPIARPHGPSAGPNEVFNTICSYAADTHPKVRQAALGAILRQHMMGTVLPVETYDECVVATKDDFEQVRLVAIELVWAISSAYPEYPVVIQKYATTETIRLLDDAFVKICDMVNDSSVVVRQRACAILGRYRNVKHMFLSQTFSKQVMSNLRRFVPRSSRGQSGRGRNRGHRSGPASTSIPTPKGDVDVDSDEFKLLDSGAAGAFVHGLEDEYQEVRDAAIESITELSIGSSEFAAKAVDFLVDMFNDSSDRVRLCAIRALVAIGDRLLIPLTEEQLSIALSAMKDASHVVREGIYAFLAVSVVAKPESLTQLMAAIKSSLDKYPDDLVPIYRALKALGHSHSKVIDAPFVRALLGISEHYLSREARIDDTVYAGNVILIMNTDSRTRKMLAHVLPNYVFSHLPYLRDKYQGSFPQDIAQSVPAKLEFVKQMLEQPRDDPAISQLSLDDSQRQRSSALANVSKALCLACNRVEEPCGSVDGSEPLRQTELALLLARRVGEFEICPRATSASTTATSPPQEDCAVVDYARAIERVLIVQSRAAAMLRRQEHIELAAKIMLGSYTIESRSVGLDPSCRLALAYLRLFAHAAWLHAHSVAHYDSRLAERMYGEFALRARRTEKWLRDRSVLAPELVDLVQRQSPFQDELASPHRPGHEQAAESLLTFISRFKPLSFSPAGRCQLVLASCSKTVTARRPIEFNHIFPLNISLAASLAWVAHRSRIVVTVTLPTNKSLTLHPPPSALKPLSPMHWSLEWDEIPVSLPLSSGESTAIGLTIALQHPADTPWSDSFIIEGTMVPDTYKVEIYYKSAGAIARRHICIPIADASVSVGVNPVEFKPPPSSFTRV
ncbi:hypothetical protein GGI20_000429 [Coemansia sp. BCRC 34301]|nr:hypothetical protein GGI20_000429 [Coemansia sp. BCRC 34301]